MHDVATTSEICTRIAHLKAELDELAQQVASAADGDPAWQSPQGRSAASDRECAAVPTATERQRSLRMLRDLMWQGRWGLAYHLARALESQGETEIDFPSSSIRAWALASQEGRRQEAESLRLTEELLKRSASQPGTELPPRLFEWASLIGLASGLDASKVRRLANDYSPPTELPATGRWWRNYLETLSVSQGAAKWATLPDELPATCEVEELVLHGEQEPIRLAASCLMMSIRRAMRHVRLVSTAEEQLILNAELARATSLQFAENGEVSSEAAVVERAVCDIARRTPDVRAVLVGQNRSGPAPTGVVHEPPILAPTPGAEDAMTGIPAAEQALRAATSEKRPIPMADPLTTSSTRTSTPQERLDRYARRVGAESAARLSTPRKATVVMTSDAVARVSPRADGAFDLLRTSQDHPTASDQLNIVEPRSNAAKPVFGSGPDERTERYGIHSAALATAFGAEDSRSGPRMSSSTGHSTVRASVSSLLFQPQVAIVGGLLAIAAAIVVGLGTGLAAHESVEAASPIDSAVEPPSDVAGDFPALD